MTRRYENKNTDYYLVIFCNAQKVNQACNGSLISRGFQENGMRILYTLNATGFYNLSDKEKNEEKAAERNILCAIIYTENSNKARFMT